jgi:hypothetical protein
MPAKKEVVESKASDLELTKEGSHIAVLRGYVGGVIIERGDPVPAGVPVSSYSDHPNPSYTGWMATKAEAAEAMAETEE